MKKIYTITQVRNVLLVFMVFAGGSVIGQDIHFSMFQFSPMNHNPALTGIFNGDKRFAASYRHQWHEVPVDYMTFSASYDQNFLRTGATGFFSGGVVFDYDRAGKSELSSAFLGLTGSYTKAITPSFLVTGGAIVGGGQKAVKTENLLWGNQWNGDQVDPTLPSGEVGLDETHFYFDVGAGLNMRLQKSSRTRLDLGGAALHLNQPNNTFYTDGDAPSYIRFAAQAYGSLELFSALDLHANALAQFQGPYQEIVLSALLNIHISQTTARQVQLALGIGVRLDDALIPQVHLAYDGWRAAFSYDINTSGFDAATNERGGPEFSLIYTITKVRALDQSKLCRIH